jgi:hypothetical protein
MSKFNRNQQKSSILGKFKPYHKDTSQTQHHIKWKTCMTLMTTGLSNTAIIGHNHPGATCQASGLHVTARPYAIKGPGSHQFQRRLFWTSPFWASLNPSLSNTHHNTTSTMDPRVLLSVSANHIKILISILHA